MSKNGRILVAMSGGIDSSVAAMLLHQQGYEVIGLTMKTWDYAGAGTGKKETGCCSLDSINDARSIAVNKGFPHYILDIRSEFGDSVIDNFVDEYMAGRTPNPCVLCNTHIKWSALLHRADMLKCDYIATGHYARVRNEQGRYIVSKGIDANKDQSYVLWGLKQENLARTLFPVGGYTKQEIRKMAFEMGFEELSTKSESYEICFVPDNDYRSFLRHKKPEMIRELEGGNFISTGGKIIGKHHGYPFYTIGQRKGLDIAFGEPMYVTNINPKDNTVTLGQFDELKKLQMTVREVNIQKFERLDKPVEAITKVRYKDPGTHSTLYQHGDKVDVVFHKEIHAVAPGQSAVFYDDDDVIGGGFIEKDTALVQ